MDLASLSFWLKITLVPSFIGLVSLAGHRWGPAISGWLIALPLTSGPVVFFIALEQGAEFASNAAQGTMLGVISVATFCLLYGLLANRLSWVQCLLVSCLGFFASTFVLNFASMSLVVSFAAVICVLLLVSRYLPRSGDTGILRRSSVWDILLRMITGTSLVLVVTGSAQILGPRLSGLLAPFPIYTSVLAMFTHRFQGPSSAVQLLRGLVLGLFTFAFFFLLVALTVDEWGILISFGTAVLLSFAFHGTSLLLLRRTYNTQTGGTAP